MEAEHGTTPTTPSNYKSLLFSDTRDHLIRNNGDKVKASDLEGKKTIGIYFSAHWCPPCRQFTPELARVYTQINTHHNNAFEVVFVSADHSEEDFNGYHSAMPWLAVPFSDTTANAALNEALRVTGIPHLVIVDGRTGQIVEEDAVEIVSEHGAEGFPFTEERMKELKEAEEEAKRNQTLTSVLTSASRDFVVAGDGSKIQISEMEGKIVAIYFTVSRHPNCVEFTSLLSKAYLELKQRGEPFEVVLVSLDRVEEGYKELTKEMPWLAVPHGDQSIIGKLIKYFELETLPTLVVLGADGKTISTNLADVVEEHGANAYPFSPEKLAEFAELEKKRAEEQTLESILVVSDDDDNLDYVVGKDGVKVPIKDLVGKTILLYFSAHWCPPCKAFTPILIEVYDELRAKNCEVEVVFISSDRDQSSFDEYYSTMPWLALPFGDKRKKLLSRKFKVEGIPTLVALDPAGRTITTTARNLVMEHGSNAFPFTEEHIRKLTRGPDQEEENGEADKEEDDEEAKEDKRKENAGYVCDGDVCRKA